MARGRFGKYSRADPPKDYAVELLLLYNTAFCCHLPISSPHGRPPVRTPLCFFRLFPRIFLRYLCILGHYCIIYLSIVFLIFLRTPSFRFGVLLPASFLALRILQVCLCSLSTARSASYASGILEYIDIIIYMIVSSSCLSAIDGGPLLPLLDRSFPTLLSHPPSSSFPLLGVSRPLRGSNPLLASTPLLTPAPQSTMLLYRLWLNHATPSPPPPPPSPHGPEVFAASRSRLLVPPFAVLPHSPPPCFLIMSSLPSAALLLCPPPPGSLLWPLLLLGA